MKLLRNVLLFCFLPSFLIFSYLWKLIIFGRFYVSSPGLFFLEFLPFNGFVHPHSNDYFLNGMTKTGLLILWGLWLLLIFLFTYLLFRLVTKLSLIVLWLFFFIIAAITFYLAYIEISPQLKSIKLPSIQQNR